MIPAVELLYSDAGLSMDRLQHGLSPEERQRCRDCLQKAIEREQALPASG